MPLSMTVSQCQSPVGITIPSDLKQNKNEQICYLYQLNQNIAVPVLILNRSGQIAGLIRGEFCSLSKQSNLHAREKIFDCSLTPSEYFVYDNCEMCEFMTGLSELFTLLTDLVLTKLIDFEMKSDLERLTDE